MKRYILVILVVCLACLLVQVFSPKTSPVSHTRVTHASHLFDPAFFEQAYDKGQHYKKEVHERVLGGIIPHHLLAAPLIAGFFEGIAQQNVTTIILISPNHYGIGSHDIATSKGVWTTVFGDVETDTSKILQLEKDNVAAVSEELFDTEHGIYGITPFIKKTFPHAKIVPLTIMSGTTKEAYNKLAHSLSKITDANTLVLISADFSHYLPSAQADLHDKESIAAIRSFQTDIVFNLDRTKHVDSPEAIYTLLRLMQAKHATTTSLLQNTNSAKLTNKHDIQSTTSYLTMYFLQN